MLRDSPEQDQANKVFTLKRILAGEFDADLRRWADAARDFGTPLLAEYGTEVNGEWFPWNGVWNGGGSTKGYGDPALPDGPERFRDAYRRIIGLVRGEGAANVLWVFHANNDDWPQESWNWLENYYPGDAYIDWLAVSVYGAQTPLDDYWDEFRPTMDAVYPRLTALAPSKPIILAEFGVTLNNPLGSQSDWANKALTDLIGLRWPRIMGFSWWNEFWQNDDNPKHDTTMRVQDNPALARVFQTLVGANPNVLGRLTFPHGIRIRRRP
jgi:beta-mannanase